MGEPVIQRSFGRGEIAPGLTARADLDLYHSAARTMRNFIARRHGGAYNRPGTVFVARSKVFVGSGNVFLFPFYFAAADESYLIEAGVGYFRFYKNGARVTVSGVAAYNGGNSYAPGDLVSSAGVNYYCHTAAAPGDAPPDTDFWHALEGSIYEIPTPYTGGEFSPPAPVGWSQFGGVVTITHLSHAPRELVYGGDGTSWVLRTITTAPAIGTPQNPTGTEGTAGALVYRYVITAVDAVTFEESLPSDVIELNCEKPTEAAPNALDWDAVTGAGEYRVYLDPFQNGTFGFIGTATAITDFNDPGAVPDFANTPPKARVLFASTNNYPAVSTVHGQRRIFGGTHNDREIGHASQVGLPSNFSIRSPLQDDDAVTWKLASNRIQPIVHLLGLQQLVMLTSEGEWLLEGDEQLGVLTPTAINPRQHGYVGSSFTEPCVIGRSIIHVQARGNVLRDLRFNEEATMLGGRDLTILARHLFVGTTVDDLAFQLVPDSIVWSVRSDGTLLGMTYVEEEDQYGWHRHDTLNGEFKQVVVLPESGEDAVYVLVEREVDDTTRLYIERMEPREVADAEDYHFVDAGVIYAGSETTTIDGLDHLEGETVVVFADGAPVLDAAGELEEFTVASGAITLTTAVTSAHVGLAITCDLETLSLDVAGSPVRGRVKRTNELALLVEAGSFPGFKGGRDVDHLKTLRKEVWDTSSATVDGRIAARIEATYNYEGRVFIRHTAPAPLAILAVLPLQEVGG